MTATQTEPNFPEDQIDSPVAEGADEYAGYESYFSTQDTEKHYLPDGKQYVVLSHSTGPLASRPPSTRRPAT